MWKDVEVKIRIQRLTFLRSRTALSCMDFDEESVAGFLVCSARQNTAQNISERIDINHAEVVTIIPYFCLLSQGCRTSLEQMLQHLSPHPQ